MNSSKDARRRFLNKLGAGLGIGVAHILLSGSASAAPSAEAIAKRRLQNRLELWAAFSQQSQTLIARYHSTRWSSLLEEPLEADGQLFFIAPHTLVLRDSGFSGSVTRIVGIHTTIVSTQSSGTPTAPGEPTSGPDLRLLPGLRWCSDRLLRVFAPGTGKGLIADARHEVPRGRSARFILRPELGDLARLEIRDLTLKLDPVGGAPLRIDIAQTQGDRHRLELGDHRQGLSPNEVEELIARG